MRFRTELRLCFITFALLCFFCTRTYSATGSSFVPCFPLPTICQIDAPTQPSVDDGYNYYEIKSRLHFKRSQTEFEESYLDNETQIKTIIAYIDSIGSAELMTIELFGSASPEGDLRFNTWLAKERAGRLKAFLYNKRPEIFHDNIDWNITYAYEDWSQAVDLLKQSNIKYREEAIEVMENAPYYTYDKSNRVVGSKKKTLMELHGGRLWKEMDKTIFPYCRCADLHLIIRRPKPAKAEPVVVVKEEKPIEKPAIVDTVKADTIKEEVKEEPWRQPMLAVKTNLLLYGLYMSKYGWAPVPNIAVEYLPRTGHYTVGASLDIPWFRNYENHKFFQVRNWQIEGRRYFRESAQYWGWYVQAYAHIATWGVGFNKEEGWQGESFGGGIGGGYVMPISKDKHWKLEFNLQLGYVRTKYDPYVYGHPADGAEDGWYYYDWKLDPDLFSTRRYKHNWLGPTRVGVTLSYDLLYYKKKK